MGVKTDREMDSMDQGAEESNFGSVEHHSSRI